MAASRVSVNAGGEGVEARQVVLPDGAELFRQLLALAAVEHDREGSDAASGRI